MRLSRDLVEVDPRLPKLQGLKSITMRVAGFGAVDGCAKAWSRCGSSDHKNGFTNAGRTVRPSLYEAQEFHDNLLRMG